MASATKKKSTRKASNNPRRSTASAQKTEVLINVYDLLPPGRLATILWTLGSSLLHSGVVINGKEYAYGGHDQPGLSGVYWTKPRTDPPGGTFKCEILQGFTMQTDEEIDAMIKEVSEEFLGPAYNLLNKNCNHFTSALCQKMTSRPAPGWLNRAASIGVALPCVVPREWIAPPDHETADGELIEEDQDNENERSRMLQSHALQQQGEDKRDQEAEDTSRGDSGQGPAGDQPERAKRETQNGKALERDTGGRMMPASEQAPVEPVGDN